MLAWYAWVYPCFQVTLLPIVFERLVEVWNWKTIVYDLASILHWILKNVCQVFIFRVLVQIFFLPSLNMFSIPNYYIEVWVHQQHNIFLHLSWIHLDGLWFWFFYCVPQQCWLNHYWTIRDRFPHQTGSLVDGLIRRWSKRVNDTTSPKMIHILRKMFHIWRETEGTNVRSIIDGKPNTELE